MDSNHYCLSSPTTEIRLLDLLPATASGTLAARIRRFSLDDTPPYISISHVWGSEKATNPLHIESGCGNKDIQISRHLESLLVGLLCHTVDTLPEIWSGRSRLPIWIDMICINQTDVGEKAAQIPLMRRIYSKATAVIIWINEYDSYLRYAFHYLHRTVNQISRRQDEHNQPSFDPMGYDSIKRLLDCQWFHRRWVLQEVTVSQRAVFLCGADVLTLEDLFLGIDMTLKYATVGIFRPLLALREISKSFKDQRHLKLLWLLENLRLTQTTLPHDKVYGLLGFCSLEEATGNPIRYDLEPEEAYRTSVVTHQNRHFSAPSWVPNWDSQNLRRCLGLSQIAHDEKYFDAPGTLSLNYSFNKNELVVSGVMLDYIRVVGDFVQLDRRAELSHPDSRIFQQYFDFYMSMQIEETPYRDELGRARAFSRTLSLLGVYLTPIPSPDDLPEMFYRWCQGSILGNQLEERGLKYQAPQTDNQKGIMGMKRLLSWQPFVTQRGYIGLAREKCSFGDEIWIIGGCSVPVLFSQTADGNNREVRGEVLIDGFMFGEITKDPNNLPSVEKVSLA
ncbi:heterokaryon incompatibility protein-domain-containing protein [Xylaria sp. FL1042]|nr:heterokaryon incompatibility protein-domain-containing protein [Xylaria sp. FL1042]